MQTILLLAMLCSSASLVSSQIIARRFFSALLVQRVKAAYPNGTPGRSWAIFLANRTDERIAAFVPNFRPSTRQSLYDCDKCPHNSDLHQVYGSYRCCVTRKTHISSPVERTVWMCGKERNFRGKVFWTRGYAVSTVGFEPEQIRKYAPFLAERADPLDLAPLKLRDSDSHSYLVDAKSVGRIGVLDGRSLFPVWCEVVKDRSYRF